jgi:protein SMG7
MDAISPNHAETVRDDYFSLVSQRELPPDIIFKTVILSQAALWKHRMIIEPVGAHKDGDSEAPSAMDAAAIEKRILIHVLAIHETLLQVGIAEIADAPPEENHLAQRITATFRRTLPALRISSKWLMANFKYVFQIYDSMVQHASNGFDGPSSDRRKDSHTTELEAMVSRFWHTYTQFSIDLRKTFPLERLPRLNATLEEDVDTRGFLPLQKIGDLNDTGSGQNQQTDAVGENKNVAEGQGNPNEEQLMRIADLLEDASIMTELVELEASLFFI